MGNSLQGMDYGLYRIGSPSFSHTVSSLMLGLKTTAARASFDERKKQRGFFLIRRNRGVKRERRDQSLLQAMHTKFLYRGLE
jgi:hypothetical protein